MSVFTDFAALRDRLVAKFEVPLATVTTTAQTQTLADRIAGTVTATTSSRTVPALVSTRKLKQESGEIVRQAYVTCFAAVAVGEIITLGTTSGEIITVEMNDPTGAAPYTWTATLR